MNPPVDATLFERWDRSVSPTAVVSTRYAFVSGCEAVKAEVRRLLESPEALERIAELCKEEQQGPRG